MIKAEPELASKSQWVVKIQLAVTTLVALLFFYQGHWAALSAVYGGLISVASSYFLSRGVARATELAKDDPRKGMTTLYVGAVQRFIGVIALLALGMAVLKLQPLAILVGFAGAQAGFLLATRMGPK